MQATSVTQHRDSLSVVERHLCACGRLDWLLQEMVLSLLGSEMLPNDLFHPFENFVGAVFRLYNRLSVFFADPNFCTRCNRLGYRTDFNLMLNKKPNYVHPPVTYSNLGQYILFGD